MKHPWLAYVIVGLLAAGAGVAIAGLPDTTPVAATITVPTTDVEVDDTSPESTTTDSTETTASPTTVPESTTPDTTAPATTTPPDTTEPEPPDSVPADLPERSELSVVAANGANVAGSALRMAATLEELGYVDVLPLNGSEIVEFTAVYFVEGFDDAAQRLADDLEVLDVFVGSIDNAPSVAELPDDVELLVYIGIDRS